MKTREQNRNNKLTEIERFDWFVERIQTLVEFWLVRRMLGGKKLRTPELSGNQSILCFDVILKYDWPIEQCRLHMHEENKESMFFDKANNEHLPKPFFEVIGKPALSI